ncbi:hypothetical protein ABZ642_19935 [Streptomyces sp. NPDC007157]
MNALQARTVAPLQTFVASWAVFVAIERHPARAARLREGGNRYGCPFFPA